MLVIVYSSYIHMHTHIQSFKLAGIVLELLSNFNSFGRLEVPVLMK